ncbi:hypothetical protein D5086_005267 [Populus alba]|uniref:Uncharacterized protein n=1 Tax=Populus alba TaxID=43335 RepID=A0ACC4CSV1_POPAL
MDFKKSKQIGDEEGEKHLPERRAGDRESEANALAADDQKRKILGLLGWMSGEANDPFSGGLFRPNGRKRGRFHSSDYGDGGVNAKLYVAPIPRTTTEENIRSLFEEHGSVVEVVLPRDKRTGQQQAYCFVKYTTFEEADRAIRALHNQHTIPGEVVPFKVRYADGERERPGGFVDKLYVGSINKLASKQEIEEIFSPYGHVEDVYIARDELKQSRGCAFVKFAQRDMALAAIKGLNGTLTMRGCDQPLIVRFADPKKPKTGELRGSYAFGGPNFGPCSQQPMIRPAPGCFLPNASFSMQQTSTTGVPQAVAHAAKQELVSPHITEQPLSSVKHSPSQLSQMPLQHMQAPEKCFQSPQQAIFDTHKQTQILEQQQNQQIALQEPTWTTNTQPASRNSVTSAVPPSPQIVDPGECDWSEHSCPDGYKNGINEVSRLREVMMFNYRNRKGCMVQTSNLPSRQFVLLRKLIKHKRNQIVCKYNQKQVLLLIPRVFNRRLGLLKDLAVSFIFHAWKVVEVLDLWPYSVELRTSGILSSIPRRTSESIDGMHLGIWALLPDILSLAAAVCTFKASSTESVEARRFMKVSCIIHEGLFQHDTANKNIIKLAFGVEVGCISDTRTIENFQGS